MLTFHEWSSSIVELLDFQGAYGAPQRVFADLSPTALTKRLSEGGIRGLDD